MNVGHAYQTDVNERMTERLRLIALWAGSTGLLVNVFVCLVYMVTGNGSPLLYTEVGIYAALLSFIVWSAYTRFRVKHMFVTTSLCILAVFWIWTFLEGAIGHTAVFEFPLVLFIPLFLVIMLDYQILLSLAPVQAMCVFFFTRDHAIDSIGPYWSASDQIAYAVTMAGFSGFSFCALGIVSYARERTDSRMFDLVTEKEALASRDGLTGLMNRRAFMDELRRLWAHQSTIEIAFIDLDHFKPLNDQYGHAMGDFVLKTVADRIAETPGVLASARLGGDEFAVVLRPPSGTESADDILALLHQNLTADIASDAGLLTIGGSIGYASGNTLKQSLASLLRSADAAMRRAKSLRFGWVKFDPRIDNAALASSTLEIELKAAIKNGQIKAAVQPIADAKTRKVVAYELLTRWTNSGFERDPSPKDFIPVAEKLGLLNDILWVTLDEALTYLSLTDQKLAVNVSPAQLLATDFLSTLQNVLAKHRVPPAKITLEITEEVAFRNVDRNVAVLKEARALGMSIALDDFGTGYSSLSMLDTLPLDKLKIDQSFVRKSNQSEQSKSILLAAIRLGKQLGLQSCVEGIESSEVAARVAVFGADTIQGYWLGRPQLVTPKALELKQAS
jgi:diguanylate cyclase (GGDEF)-like protein